MFRLISFGLFCFGLAIGWVSVVAETVISGSLSFISVFAIFFAAVLVRLNRGLPNLEWKSVDPKTLGELLREIEAVAQVYVQIAIINGTGILLAMAASSVNSEKFVFYNWADNAWSSVLCGLLGLSFGRMLHLLWLDVDVVRLQSKLVQFEAEEKDRAVQKEIALGKYEAFRSARLPTEKP